MNRPKPRLRRLSGDEVIAILGTFGFYVHAQAGSHAKLRRVTETRATQTLTVPRHRELATGTLRAILRQASRFIPEDDLERHFYTD